MAPKKPRCQLNEKTEDACRSPAQLMLGPCDFCKHLYCSKHRLLEDHKCPGLEDVCDSLSSSTSSPNPRQNPEEIEWWKVGLGGLLGPEDLDLDTLCAIDPKIGRVS
ncbi:hypothetical protein MKZ38_004861 [Zalerion maritima]|uniref:AN1-type domain-containing protein n=1 Tax=Zalerion maritima TaxID=339359 RepID=A0AAD5RL52_9PEZI|nr:hypothetical protein MKZ38_004861 [Zalerion maritima]